MTERLYYQDPLLERFEATLLRQERRDEGGETRWTAVLDRTAFYPEGGGQPADRGTLAGLPVLDVQEQDGEVLHFLSQPLSASSGSTVQGAVDMDRRLDFMRQHTGQHIVSAGLLAAAGLATVSASLGEEYTSVEIDAPSVSEGEIAAAEDRANHIVNENHPVRIHWVSAEEARRFVLRKPPPARERLRIVEIPGIDASACGGLHVASTGEVGLIRLGYQEKIRGRMRLQWKIGARAWRELRDKERILAELGRELTCGTGELAATVQNLKARLRTQELAGARLEKRLAELLAAELLAAAERIGDLHLVCSELDSVTAGTLAALFEALVRSPRTVACLTAPAGDILNWIMGSSEELNLSLEEIVPPLLPLIEGRGGGRGRRWQGIGRRLNGSGEFFSALARVLRESSAS